MSILFFPLFFQNEFFSFAWGVGEPWPLRLVKWLFLLPAVLAFLLACWVTMASLITIPIRQNRSAFVTGLLITWWDLGRSVFAFWGGAFRFVFYLAAALLAVLKLIVIGVWAVLQDFILFPFRVVKNLGENVTKAGVPWIAVFLTLIWAVLEAAIFTYVTTPVVIDTFSNMTGNELGEASIRIPLFIFMLFIVLGSYAVLSTWTEAVFWPGSRAWSTRLPAGPSTEWGTQVRLASRKERTSSWPAAQSRLSRAWHQDARNVSIPPRTSRTRLDTTAGVRRTTERGRRRPHAPTETESSAALRQTPRSTGRPRAICRRRKRCR